MATRRDGRFVWVTWLAKLMAGETTCEWSTWFKTHNKYAKVPSDFDQAAYQVQHTRALRELRLARQAAGEEISFERQNQFYWERPNSSLVLGGAPDLIAVGDNVVRVYDAKTGVPRDSHQVQVMIYMHCLPDEAPVYRDNLIYGAVVYPDHQVDIPPTAMTPDFVDTINYFLNILDSSDEPDKMPSPAECRFCDIPKAECPERSELVSGDSDRSSA